jgi:FAD/FMN-containing dehydrogenase
MPTLSVPDLRAALTGRVLGPGDDGYEQARLVFYRHYDHHPAVIAQAADASDVACVIETATRTGLALTVKAGGHSVAGHGAADDAIMLDLSAMKGLEIDAEGRTAWAETGLTAGEYTRAVGAHGLATGFGDTPTVGIAGLTLGGGVGYLVRKHGLTIDNLLAAEIVTADGQRRHVDAETEPDLFWAIRGGGGNFGVVTRLKLRLHEVGTVLGGMLLLPATAEVIESFVAAALAAPDELSAIANIMIAPPMEPIPPAYHGRLVMMAMLVYAGPLDEGERVVAPFRAIAPPLADLVAPIPYPDIFEEMMDHLDGEEAARSFFLDHVDRVTAETIVERFETARAPIAVIQLRALGGAMARVPADATAYAHRTQPIMVSLGNVFEDLAEADAHRAWVADFAAAIDQGVPGVYVNFVGHEGPERVRDAYPGATWDRLAAIKRTYDPGNLFRGNQNIPPA